MSGQAFRAFIRRIGPAEAARRFGVVEATVSVWAQRGKPSKNYQASVAQALARSAAAVRAAKTRKENEKYAGRLPKAPPENRIRKGPRGGLYPEHLSPEDRAGRSAGPIRAPKNDPVIRRARRRVKKGWRTGHFGEHKEGLSRDLELFMPGEEVNTGGLERVMEMGVAIFRQFRARYPHIAFTGFIMRKLATNNPAYTGTMAARAKRGDWIHWYSSSAMSMTEDGVRMAIAECWQGRQNPDSSGEMWSRSRQVIWLAMNVRVWREWDDAPTKIRGARRRKRRRPEPTKFIKGGNRKRKKVAVKSKTQKRRRKR